MRRLSMLFTMLGLIVAGCSVSNPGETIVAYLSAHNSGDVELAMSHVADPIHFEVDGDRMTKDAAAIRMMEEWDTALFSRLVGTDFDVSGDTVTFDMVETNDWLTTTGLGQVTYTDVRVVVRDKKIVELFIERDPAVAARMDSTYSEILAWARENERSEALAIIMPDSEFVMSAESASVWMNLTREWLEATSETDTSEVDTLIIG